MSALESGGQPNPDRLLGALLKLGRRGAPLPFHALLLSLLLPLATAVTWTALTRPDEFRFEGASLGVDISLAWLGPALFGGFAILALWWVVRDVRRRRVRTPVPWSWTRLNAIRLAVIAVLFPVEAMLLRGELGSVREAAGVAVTASQWFILNRASTRRDHPGGLWVLPRLFLRVRSRPSVGALATDGSVTPGRGPLLL